MITGTDPISLDILWALREKNMKVKEVPEHYPVSLDQAKRLSRYANMLQQAENCLSDHATERLKTLGLKALYLAPLFKAYDWDGLNELLPAVDAQTKREDLPHLIAALHKKRERVKQLQEDVKRRRRHLEQIESAAQEKLVQLGKLHQKVKDTIGHISKYDSETQEFLLQHVGTHTCYNYRTHEREEAYVLIMRLDSRFQEKLKGDGILSYDPSEYVHRITDLDRFVMAYRERRTNKRARVLWDPDVEWKRSKQSVYRTSTPSSGRYKYGKSLVAKAVLDEIEEVNRQLVDIEQQRQALLKEMRNTEKATIQSFLEAAVRPTITGDKQLKLHQQLQHEGAKWLYTKGYAVVLELTLPNGRRVDIAGANEEGHIIFIEVKASRADFQSDEKWTEYLPYCHGLFFLGERYQVEREWNKTERDCAGFLFQMGNHIEVARECPQLHEPQHTATVPFLIMRAASKKVVYGF